MEGLAATSLRRVGPTDRFFSDAVWANDGTFAVTVGTVDEQQLGLLGVTDGRLRIISTGQPFKHTYDDGMAVSPDGKQLAMTLTENTTTKVPGTEIVLMDLATGNAQTLVPMSDRRPRMPAWSSAGQLVYLEDTETGATLETLSLATAQATMIDTQGYRLYDLVADDNVMVFDGLDRTGTQGLFATSLANFAPRQIEAGSYSMPSLRFARGLVASVATGHDPGDAGDIVVDSIPIAISSSRP